MKPLQDRRYARLDSVYVLNAVDELPNGLGTWSFFFPIIHPRSSRSFEVPSATGDL
jgi:hypothetical protein